MISVIVPIYNVEEYLEPCLCSIINQTYRDLEILCIDDCTLDNSINIVKRYMQQDRRIRLISHKENRGLGGARNTGIREARGEYISFVDSDDVLDLTMLEKMHNAITTHAVDAVVCGIRRFQDKTEISRSTTFHYLSDVNSRVFNISQNKERLCDIWPSAPNKLYKADIIARYSCRFPEKLLYEDHFFFYSYFQHVTAFFYINKPLYSYRASRKGSITSTITGRENEVFKVLTDLGVLFSKVLDESAYAKAYAKICFRLIWERSCLLYSVRSEWLKFAEKSEKWLLERFDLDMLESSVDTSIEKTDAFYRYIFTRGFRKKIYLWKLSAKDKPWAERLRNLYYRVKGYRTNRQYLKELVWVAYQNNGKLQEFTYPVWRVHDTYMDTVCNDNENTDL